MDEFRIYLTNLVRAEVGIYGLLWEGLGPEAYPENEALYSIDDLLAIYLYNIKLGLCHVFDRDLTPGDRAQLRHTLLTHLRRCALRVDMQDDELVSDYLLRLVVTRHLSYALSGSERASRVDVYKHALQRIAPELNVEQPQEWSSSCGHTLDECVDNYMHFLITFFNEVRPVAQPSLANS